MSTLLNTLAALFVAHWVGDYLLQSNTIASRKSSSVHWLSIHVLIYSAVLFVVSCFFFGVVNALAFTLINGVLHWMTDFLTGRLSSRYKDKPRVYFPIIGFDQLIHTLTLLVTSAMYVR